MDNTQRSREERLELFNKVEALRKTGLTRPEACRKIGIPLSSYNNWQTAFSGKKAKPRIRKKAKVEVMTLPMQSSRAFLIVGSTRDITEILNGVN